jgi:hypothetical protein
VERGYNQGQGAQQWSGSNGSQRGCPKSNCQHPVSSTGVTGVQDNMEFRTVVIQHQVLACIKEPAPAAA